MNYCVCLQKVCPFLCTCLHACVCVKESVCGLTVCHLPLALALRFPPAVTSCLSVSSGIPHTSTIALEPSLYSSFQICSIHPAIYLSMHSGLPDHSPSHSLIISIEKEHRVPSDEREEMQKGGGNHKCRRLEAKTRTSRKSKTKAEMILMINPLSTCFSDPIFTGAVSTLGVFKGMYQGFP